MAKLRKRLFAGAGYNTIYYGPGRKEFNPKELPPYEGYLQETAKGTLGQIPQASFDEGVIGSFMSGKFLNQANLPGFIPFMVPQLEGKPCTAVEGACGTGGRAIAAAANVILADRGEAVFTAAFEMQNGVKSVYGADILAGASYYAGERKQGSAYFFPGIFSERAGAYFNRHNAELARQGMALWYEQAIVNARKNPKAQEYHNTSPNLYSLALTLPDPKKFLQYLNIYDCSKITDGASSIALFSEEGVKKAGLGMDQLVEIVAIEASESDITKPPEDPTRLQNTQIAVQKALASAGLTIDDIGIFEIHDCFTITALLSIEALRLAPYGAAAEYILEGLTASDSPAPINPSGGLIGFGHPTGASGIRQLVDLHEQLVEKAANQITLKKQFGMMLSMGGNDKTVTCIIVKKLG